MSGWRVVPLQGSLGPHAVAWDALNTRAFENHPLLTSVFVEGLLRNFGDGSEHLCVLEDAGQVRSMCVLRRRNPILWTSFLPAQCQLAPTLVSDAGLLASLLPSLPGCVVQLDLLCNDPDVGDVLGDTLPQRLHSNHALTIKIELLGQFEDYWSSRSRHLQSNIRRYEKRVAANGLAPRLARITGPDQIAAAVERYAALEAAGWKGRSGSALGSSPAQYQFYLDVMLGSAGACVHELWFGEQLAASRLVLLRDRKQVMLKTSYDEKFAQYAPGRLLLRAVIEDAFRSNPHGSVEFYTDANKDLLLWATGQRWMQHTTLYRGPVVERALFAVRALRAGDGLAADVADEKRQLAVEVFAHPAALPGDAQHFMDRAAQRNVSFGTAWYRNLVETVYPANQGIRFYVLHKAAKIIAVLPLRTEKVVGGWQLHSLSNFYTTLYEPSFAPELKPAELAFLLAAIRAHFPRLVSLTLSPMDPASHAYRMLKEAMRMKGWYPFEYFAFGNWYQPVVSGWADYLAARNGALRNTIKRMSKKFAADGGALAIVSETKDMAIGIAAFNDVYAASWKKPEPFPAFMPGLLQTCAELGFLRLGLAWLNGKPVAAQLWIVSHGRAEIYKVAYDEGFKHYAPGTLLTAMLMKHVTEVDKVAEVDYLIGDDPYKKSWMSDRRERWGIVVHNPRTMGGLAGLAYEALARTIKRWRHPAQADAVKAP